MSSWWNRWFGKSSGPKKDTTDRWAARARDRRSQPYDRQEALDALAKLGTAKAVAALLQRFAFSVEPSVTDQEEKETAFRGILHAKEEALAPLRVFALKAESLAWPIKILHALVPPEAYVAELLVWLARWDTEYTKTTDPKVQLLSALAHYPGDASRAAIAQFLWDVDEPTRFHAVLSTLAQETQEVVLSLTELFCREESYRIKEKIAQAYVERKWIVPEPLREAVQATLAHGFTLTPQGHITIRRSV